MEARFVVWFALLAAVAGCTGEGPALTTAPMADRPLTVSVDGVDVATFRNPGGIEWLCSQLPARDHERLIAEGSCTTSDTGFKAAVIELLGKEPEARRGFEGLNPRVVTWGQIKVRYS